MTPVEYDTANLWTSKKQPSTVHCTNTAIVSYFKKYLATKLQSVFTFDGLPETWDKDYFITNLYRYGFLTVFNTDKFGIIPQTCSVAGLNVFYRPIYCIVANPLIRNAQKIVIGQDCELIKLNHNYCGIMDIVDTYADMMGLCMESVAVSLVNSKVAFVFKAEDKTSAESLKKMYDTINAGNPAVFIDKHIKDTNEGNSWEMLNGNVKNTYITSDLLNDLRTIENMFCTEIGIPNANYNKRERLVSDEVNANRVETFSNASVWLSCLKESISKVNKMFGLNISVKFSFGGVVDAVDSDNV